MEFVCLELLMGEGYSDNKSYLSKSHFLPSLGSPVHLSHDYGFCPSVGPGHRTGHGYFPTPEPEEHSIIRL